MGAMETRAVLLVRLGKLDEADELYRDAVAGYRRILGEHDQRTLRCLGNGPRERR